VHAALDDRTRVFAAATGVRCPDRCGRCCRSPHVETTVADLLPLARELVGRGAAWDVLERIAARGNDASCVLYAPDRDDPDRGRCSMYDWRPSICRLFGFAGRRDADGRPQLSACRVHAEHQPEVTAGARSDVAAGRIPLPLFAEASLEIASAAPGFAARPRPINDALAEAVRGAALAARLGAMRDQRDAETPPSTPRRPAGRAA
jgi:Fe-S-cluster containining protein